MKHVKKALSLILVLALLLPGMVFANELNGEVNVEPAENEVQTELTKEEQATVNEVTKLIQDIVREKGLEKDLEVDYDDNEIVRIIVELEEKPVIVYANELGQKYEDMSYSQRSSIESQIYAAQEAVKNQIAARNIDMVYERSFNTVFSGFSGEVRFEDIETIENIPGVKKVYISNEYERPEEPDMVSSHDMIGSQYVWGEDIGYKGEGMVIAIIDTGVDPAHKDFVLSEGTEQKLTEEGLEAIEGLKGTFHTDKVPYGYNYYDKNQVILDDGPGASEHGMHVAGTAAANGDVKGVAPEAQVLAMKVFSNDPIYATTFDDIYLEAIEEAIKLKADVLNMSLGSSASFYIANSAVDTAITNAVNNGIVCSISAGNSGHIYDGWENYNGHNLPFKEDPDYGVVGAPGLSKDSLQVASIENLKSKSNYLEYIIPSIEGVLPINTFIIGEEAFYLDLLKNDAYTQNKAAYALDNNLDIFIKTGVSQFYDLQGKSVSHDRLPEVVKYRDENKQFSQRVVLPDTPITEGEKGQIPMTISGPVSPRNVFGDNPVKYVDCGTGTLEEFEGKNLEGKLALIIRGGNTFVEKIMNAQNAGAAGVIVYNHADGGEELINMMYPDSEEDGFGEIPAVFIGHKGGMALVEAGNATITFPEGKILAPNAKGGQMSDFTSWGTTPTLELKPEITAPGGMIYSTLQNNEYGYMSGTSMSAPHVSGGSALVMQYIKNDEKFASIKDNLEAQTRLAKALLMNTATIITDEEIEYETPYSPRRQGAGLMNLRAAVTTPVYIVNASTNEAKVELKDFEDTTITMNLKAINLTGDELTYNVDVDVLADIIVPGYDLNLLKSRHVTSEMTVDDKTENTITIPANGEKTFTVTIDFSEDKDVYRNMFIEGFVKLTETTDNKPAISIPYVGFYGNWNEPRILDAMRHEIDENNRPYYLIADYDIMSEMLELDGGKIYGFGEKIAFAPEDSEETSKVVPTPYFLRNAEEVQYNILDKDGNRIRTISKQNYVRKYLFDGGRGLNKILSINDSIAWDGTARSKLVDDGLYYYQIKAQVHKGDWQEKNIPVYVDTVGPNITDLEYNEETGMLSWAATDETTGVAYFAILVNGDIATDTLEAKTLEIEGQADRYQYEINEFVEELPKDQENSIAVIALDYAWNDGEGIFYIGEGKNNPYIYLEEPGLLEVYDKSEVDFNGYIYKEGKILKTLKIAGEEVFFRENSRVPVYDDEGKIVDYAPGYEFMYTLKDLEDGVHEIKIEAETVGGKKFDIVRRFFVDTTKPTLTYEVETREPYSKTADIKITMSDNFPILELYVFNSMEFNYDGFDEILKPQPANETITVTVDLDLGENSIPLKIVDVAGNESTEIVKIERTAPSNDECVELDKEALEIIFAKGDTADSVTKDLTLPNMGEWGSFITWESSNADVITNDGKVTRPNEDTEVTLTATIAKGEATDTKEFTVTVKAVDKTALNAKILEAEKLEERFYTAESWTGFPQALADAKTVATNEIATQEEVDEALADLTSAMEALVEDEIITAVTGKYGQVNEGGPYVAYVLFNVKEGFVKEGEVVTVLIDGVGLEMKDGVEDYDYRFEGMLEGEPTTVVIKIGDNKFDVSEGFTWLSFTDAEIEEIRNLLSDK